MNAHTPIDHAPDAIDLHAGLRLREMRRAKGWSQEALAEAGGVSFQQIQKYERGANRMSLSRAYKLALALGGNPADFYTGLPSVEVSEAAASFMPWAVTSQGLRWIALGQRIASEDFPKVADCVALIVREG